MSKPKAHKTGAPHRKAAEAKGRRAERWAAAWLRLRGYRILARNFRLPQGEVDIIARRASQLCFIEVKARPTEAQALEAVSPNQRKRIEAAASGFLAKHPDLSHLDVRLDVVAVTNMFSIRLMEDAWRPEMP